MGDRKPASAGDAVNQTYYHFLTIQPHPSCS
jgi:hypothetical protein